MHAMTIVTDFRNVLHDEKGGVMMQERLIARRGRNNLYTIRSQTADHDPNGPMMSCNPFNFFAKLIDYCGGYDDYTLTEAEAKIKLNDFEFKNPKNG